MGDDKGTDRMDEIPASEILGKIARGKDVIYDYVIVTDDLGPLTLAMLKIYRVEASGGRVGWIEEDKFRSPYNFPYRMGGPVKSRIQITNSIIQGKVTFEEIIFFEEINFQGTFFANIVSFMGSTFLKHCIFEGAYFKEPTHFSDMKECNPRIDKHAYFIGYNNFRGTRFEKYVDFNKVEFEQSAEFGSQNAKESTNCRSIFKGNFTHFENARFSLQAHFEECEFYNNSYFTGSHFLREAYFNKSKFGSHSDFRLVKFHDNTYFNNAIFSGGAGFAESTFKKNADFRKVTFNGDYGNFRATQFSGEFVSFKNAKFRNLCDQSVACKKARKQLEDSGSRGEADHNFFMEMEAKRKQKGITKVNNDTSKLLLQPTLKLSSEFFEDLIKEGLTWRKRLSIILQFLNYNLVGSKMLAGKFFEDINKKETPWRERLSIFLHFIWHNLLEVIIFRHIFGGYGIYWQWIFIWWLFFALTFGL